MAQVKISKELKEEILRKFLRSQAEEITDLMETLEENPHKGKALGQVEGIVIKELKYSSFRFYFITDGFVLRFGTAKELAELVIEFIKMSNKKDQKKVIKEIKKMLENFSFENL